MAYDTKGMVSVDEMLPSVNKVYRTNIGCVMYAGNGVWEGYDDVRVFPTHWLPDVIKPADGQMDISLKEETKKTTFERFLEADASLAHIRATHKRRKEIFFERIKERLDVLVDKSVWEGQLSTIRRRSELNTIKYRRK